MLPNRVWDRIYVPPLPGGCWEWLGTLTTDGYGQVRPNGYDRVRLVHRLVYEAYLGLIPKGLQIDHLCRYRRCCNPSHLEAVTSSENNRRQARLTRVPAGAGTLG